MLHGLDSRTFPNHEPAGAEFMTAYAYRSRCSSNGYASLAPRMPQPLSHRDLAAQAACDAWNAQHAHGPARRLRLDLGGSCYMGVRTRSVAVVRDGVAVVLVDHYDQPFPLAQLSDMP